ncbi:MAG: annexin [Candidatus Gastranaerophilales bacterium]|nr:annexin [Candidatus Gastranaerophilales bacterium]
MADSVYGPQQYSGGSIDLSLQSVTQNNNQNQTVDDGSSLFKDCQETEEFTNRDAFSTTAEEHISNGVDYDAELSEKNQKDELEDCGLDETTLKNMGFEFVEVGSTGCFMKDNGDGTSSCIRVIASSDSSVEPQIVHTVINQADGSADTKTYSKSEFTDLVSTQKAKEIADDLYESMEGFGTDEAQFEEIFDSTDLSDDDWVEIAEQYINNHGSLVSDIDSDFSFLSGKTEKFEKYAQRLLNAAANGNEKAVNILCQELHNGTAGQIGTSDKFVAKIFAADDDVLSKIISNYSSATGGSSITKDIKGDFSWGTQDKYIKIIERLRTKK